MFIDPDGRNGVVSGSGTKDDPYVITANYYYYNLNEDQTNALNSALAEFNNGGQAFEIKTETGTVYTSFNLNAVETVDADAATSAARGDYVEMADGSRQHFGNTVTVGDVPDNANGRTFGNANNVDITLDENSVQEALVSNPGAATATQLRQGSLVHEIGHNLAGNHGDPGNIMGSVSATEIRKENCAAGDCGTGRYNYNVPSVNTNGIRAITGRIGMPYGSVNSNYLKDRENNRVAKEGGVTVGRILKKP
ncbi:MAG: hypothetical protein SF052_09715 [Bacteroidia bacterium]|nr:hypothetical protein [Bacteroidia bacterium]